MVRVEACPGDTVRLVAPTCGTKVRWRAYDPHTKHCLPCSTVTHPSESITFVKNVCRPLDLVAETRERDCNSWCVAAQFAVRFLACAAPLALDVDKPEGACLGTDFTVSLVRLPHKGDAETEQKECRERGPCESESNDDDDGDSGIDTESDSEDPDACCKCPRDEHECNEKYCVGDLITKYWWEPSEFVVAGQCSPSAVFRPRIACPLLVQLHMVFANSGCTHHLERKVDVFGTPTISPVLLSKADGMFSKQNDANTAAACVSVDTAFGVQDQLLVEWSVVESGGDGIPVQVQVQTVASGGERIAINVAGTEYNVGTEYLVYATVRDIETDCLGFPRRVQSTFWINV